MWLCEMTFTQCGAEMEDVFDHKKKEMEDVSKDLSFVCERPEGDGVHLTSAEQMSG